MNASWLDNCIMYQIYPLGLCGSPYENSWDWSNTWNAATRPVRRIDRVLLWLDQLKALNVNAVFFNPIMQSDTHGYNTRDFYTLDSRLGSNEDFAEICKILHENGIRIVLDSLFNHVGRGFWAFRDVRANMQNSAFIPWFKEIDFERNTPCNDGFFYESFNGNWDFPSLDLNNEDVVDHIFGAVRKWVDLFRFDGLRVGVADAMNPKFLERLRELCAKMGAGLGGDIALLGEVVDSGNYNAFVNERFVQGSTNYELYQAIHSSFNSKNLFELSYTLRREFGVDGLYKHTTLMNFLDNHDVARWKTIIKDKDMAHLGYGLIFALPGFPTIYYGSEWGAEGFHPENHWAMRQPFEKPEWNGLTDFIKKVSDIRKSSPALKFGSYRELCATQGQYVFTRESCGQEITVAMNISDTEWTLVPKESSGYGSFAGLYGNYTDLISENNYELQGHLSIPAKTILYLKKN